MLLLQNIGSLIPLPEQRGGINFLETIEAIVDIVDAELIENKDYAALDNSPEKRIRKLLSQLDSVRRNEHRKYQR